MLRLESAIHISTVCGKIKSAPIYIPVKILPTSPDLEEDYKFECHVYRHA